MVLSSKWWSAKIATAVSMAYGSKYELNKRNFIYSIGFFSVFLYEENTELIINASENKGMTLKGTPWSIKSSPLHSPAVLHMTQFLPDGLHMKFIWFKVVFSFCCFPWNVQVQMVFWCEIKYLYPTWYLHVWNNEIQFCLKHGK